MDMTIGASTFNRSELGVFTVKNSIKRLNCD